MITVEQRLAIEERAKVFVQKEKLSQYLYAEHLAEFVLHEIRIHQFGEEDRTAEWSRGYTKGYEDRAAILNPGNTVLCPFHEDQVSQCGACEPSE